MWQFGESRNDDRITKRFAVRPHRRDRENSRVFIERQTLYGKGIGYVDVHLLASVALAGIKLWTRDKRLQAVAREVGYALNGSKDH